MIQTLKQWFDVEIQRSRTRSPSRAASSTWKTKQMDGIRPAFVRRPAAQLHQAREPREPRGPRGPRGQLQRSRSHQKLHLHLKHSSKLPSLCLRIPKTSPDTTCIVHAYYSSPLKGSNQHFHSIRTRCIRWPTTCV